MSRLAETAADYLALRRRLGHDLADAHRLLPRFVAYLDETGASTVTIAAAVAWSTAPNVDPASSVWPRRMTVARGFARHMAGIDPATEIPPVGLIPMRQRWSEPFLFSGADVAQLMAAATSTIRWRLPAATHATLIGLLAVTGMRVGEALKLDDADIDRTDGVLVVRESKFAKTRLVPVAPSTLDALAAYTAIRDRLVERHVPAVFVSVRGNRTIYACVQETFRRLCDIAGVGAAAPRKPTVHGLRHSFAVNTLIDWHRAGENVDARLPALSTYLGHRDPRSTYWYLSAAPELLALAARRIEPGLVDQ
ncbi:MAG: tyrosine-type recombinase/integrase [Actinomycetota bacterium]|jgi:integrase|nr:tyrosine-type recombinase/integrase [Actinomycetota bacterium]